MKYVCKYGFKIERFDEDGRSTDGFIEVEAGSIWEVDEKANIIGGEVHIKNRENLEWLELSKEALEDLFAPLYAKEELLENAKPILFNEKMVRAILEGRKTVTRRVYKGIKEPYETGDILYVRETWCKGKIEAGEEPDGRDALYISQCTGEDDYIYKEFAVSHDIGMEDVKWKPAIHMRKEAARIFLKVMDVRAERLQDITNVQILSEGANREAITRYVNQMPEETKEYVDAAFRFEFAELWDSTIKKNELDKYGWDANPMVYVVEFEKLEVE